MKMDTPAYKTVYSGGVGEITEKKSRFIATVIPVSTEEEALAFIEQMKKKYWDATHNCSAYTVGLHHELARCSDDGEPQKTAGRPMLDVLLGEDIHNAAVVVTRYFGGTLLGTGGLVRAYQAAVKEGLSKSVIIEKKYGRKLIINTDYTGIGKLQYIASTMDISILSSEYTDAVTVTLFVSPEKESTFIGKLTEATAGKAVINPGDSSYYAIIDDELRLFDE